MLYITNNLDGHENTVTFIGVDLHKLLKRNTYFGIFYKKRNNLEN